MLTSSMVVLGVLCLDAGLVLGCCVFKHAGTWGVAPLCMLTFEAAWRRLGVVS